uniref:AAA domain-containing protein n=1 Tax=Segatella hominis TaxID=2518605 RepID=UPI004027D1AD
MEQTSPIQALLQQRTLLQLEYYTEKEAFRKLTEQIGMRRKVKRGDAWFPLRIGKNFYNSLNQKSIEVFRTSDEEIDHNFEFGRPVMFFQVKNHPGENSSHASSQNAASSSQGAMSSSQNTISLSQGAASSSSASNPKSIKYFSFTGTVSYVDGDRMVINVPDSVSLLDLQTEEPIGVQLSFDETSYKLMFEALDRTMKAKNNRLAYLRDLFYSHQKAGRFSFEPMKFPWLNPTQERAVNEVLWAKDVTIVHGPPGTGKTTTLVEAINETLMRESQVLVCAQSNMAVDWISEKLVDRGINVLRIGNPTRVNDKMLGFTYERRFESHPDYPQLWAIRKAIRELRSNRKKGSESFHQKMDRLRSRAAEIEIRINAELFGEARVIACTLVGSAHRLLEGMKFGTLFIDEAAQALEAACWIPMRRASRVILAGDHCQLPPTVKSIAALRAGLGKTLMERIAENKPEVVTLLKIQYRMNEDIMRFSSDWFYGGQVESAPQIKYRSILDFDHPISWIDTSNEENQITIEGEDSLEDSASTSSSSSAANQNSDLNFKEQFVGESYGRINKAEAELTLLTLAEYFTKIGKQRVLGDSIDVGIISPYRAQVQYLKKLIKKYEFFKPYRRLISVNTVDGFQGQERDVILISLVRSNDEGQIGFLKDLRRMNVAMTRARMKLIILGNKDTMTKHPFYKKLWEYVEGLNNDE